MGSIKIHTKGVPMVRVDDLDHHPKNARRGDVAAIMRSIQANGFYGYIVAQESTGYVLKGNHTLKAARRLGMKRVPVLYLDVDDVRAARIVLDDNDTSDRAQYDEDARLELLSYLDRSDALTGSLTQEDADRLFKSVVRPPDPLVDQEHTFAPPDAADDEDEEPPEATRVISLVYSVTEARKIEGGLNRVMREHDLVSYEDAVAQLLEDRTTGG